MPEACLHQQHLLLLHDYNSKCTLAGEGEQAFGPLPP